MKATQNAVGFAGVVLGLIPLVQYLITGGAGLWNLVLGEGTPMRWVFPLGALVVAGVTLVLLDRRERATA